MTNTSRLFSIPYIVSPLVCKRPTCVLCIKLLHLFVFESACDKLQLNTCGCCFRKLLHCHNLLVHEHVEILCKLEVYTSVFSCLHCDFTISCTLLDMLLFQLFARMIRNGLIRITGSDDLMYTVSLPLFFLSDTLSIVY